MNESPRKSAAFDREASLRKVRKLAWRHPEIAPELGQLESILCDGPRGAWESIAFAPGRKYLDVAKHGRRAIERARALDLHRSPPLRILDLGAGSGFFCWAAGLYGHDACGLEPAGAVPSALPNIHPHLQAMLGVRVSRQAIGRREPIRADAVVRGRYDLVTAYSVMFDRDVLPPGDVCRRWDAQDHLFFLEDLRDHRLAPGARVVLRFNLQPDDDELRPYYQAVRELMRPFFVGSTNDDSGWVLELGREAAWTAARTVEVPSLIQANTPRRERAPG